MKIKIFEADNKQEAINNLLKEGYHVATMKEVWDWRKARRIAMSYYDTGSIFIDGVIREANEKELKNLKDLYKKDARVLVLGNYGYYVVLDGNYLLSYGARFVGVKK